MRPGEETRTKAHVRGKAQANGGECGVRRGGNRGSCWAPSPTRKTRQAPSLRLVISLDARQRASVQ